MLEGSPEYEVVGEGSTARDAFGILGTVAADLVVLDSVLPGFGGALIIQAIRRRAPAVRVLILSDNCAVRDAAEAMAAGAGRLRPQGGRGRGDPSCVRPDTTRPALCCASVGPAPVELLGALAKIAALVEPA